MEISTYSLFISIPIYFLFNLTAEIPVVTLPLKGSKIKSPSLVEARMILSSSASGFWVEYLPYFFSSFVTNEIS